MIDRIFLAAFTFCLLAAGTLAIGSALVDTPASRVAQSPAGAPVLVLPAVEISVHRSAHSLLAAARPAGADAASRSQQ